MAITKEQLEERANYLGGSDIAKIMGMSSFGTPLSVYMAKVHPNPDQSEMKIGGKMEAAYWGTKLEDKVAEGFMEHTGKKVHRVNETMVHPNFDFLRANIDRRVVGEDAILECKTTSAFNSKEWANDEIPAEYILQVMWYLAVTGKEKAYIACLIGGQKLVWKEVARDRELIRQIIEAATTFWNGHVVKRIPPMATGSVRDSDMLERLYPEATPESQIELPTEYELSLMSRADIVAKMDELEAQVNKIDNGLKEVLKDAEAARVGKYLITWKSSTRNGFDTPTFKKDHADLYAEYQKKTSFRSFRVKELKEKDNGKS